MAEVIALVGLVATISQLLDYGITVTQRLNEFMTNVHDLPPSFAHINSRLPLIMATVSNLRKRADSGEFPLETEPHLKRVIEALEKELRGLDAVLRKILPSARASTWEKGIKAVKSVAAQKNVESFASVIQDYISTLTAFQISHGFDQINSEQTRRIIRSIEEHKIEEELISPRHVKKPVWMLDYDTDEHFVGRDNIMSAIEQQYDNKTNRVAIAGIGGVGYVKPNYNLQLFHYPIYLLYWAGNLGLRYSTAMNKGNAIVRCTYSGCMVAAERSSRPLTRKSPDFWMYLVGMTKSIRLLKLSVTGSANKRVAHG